ncbi:clarin-3 [Synchiropus splendidus]|uniref:clarin-3 n=1 Tax=Synchiropus splendidus TaxID=270530 RepID=UPI00237DC306|nr:clarin-3 [Synchiropus splendidus]
MPSTKKTLHYIASALISSISVGILGFAMSTQWVEIGLQCDREGSGLFNGSAVVNLDIFNGKLERTMCPSFDPPLNFKVFDKLTELQTSPAVLHTMVACFLCLCLLFSAGSILIALYNSVSNPYETYMGPIGIYSCSSISACLSVLVLIIFVINVHVTSLAKDLVRSNSDGIPVELQTESLKVQVGYFLLIPYTVLCLLAIALVYMYNHAAYTHRREQQKPTQDAPKEIMMY